jgi:murein DD-endopeptidase MepM/ murein hydrolase activator NlpD
LLTGVAFAAPGQDEVDNAYARAKQLLEEASAARDQLADVQSRLAVAAERVVQQQEEVDGITAELRLAAVELNRLRVRLDAVSERLNERAAEAFMEGPASTVGLLLGSDSFAELSDRIEYIGVVASNDADLANEVTNARNTLEMKATELEGLRSRARDLLANLRADRASLEADLERQIGLVASIEEKQRAAREEAERLSEERQDFLDALAEQAAAVITPPTGGTGGSIPAGSSGTFRVCPVDLPRVVTDSFGAPRYVGGYHPHKGDDIMAPGGTPIRAPFDGVARDSSNSIGGLAVIVQGAAGYVYNAHMSRIGTLGSVQAGDVIGYVGMTGESGAGVNHNHFEFHPASLPSSWPSSSYGYSIIEDAVNPYPLLAAVC